MLYHGHPPCHATVKPAQATQAGGPPHTCLHVRECRSLRALLKPGRAVLFFSPLCFSTGLAPWGPGRMRPPLSFGGEAWHEAHRPTIPKPLPNTESRSLAVTVFSKRWVGVGKAWVVRAVEKDLEKRERGRVSRRRESCTQGSSGRPTPVRSQPLGVCVSPAWKAGLSTGSSR